VAMGVLFTLGMTISILRGTCRNQEEVDGGDGDEAGGGNKLADYGTTTDSVPLLSSVGSEKSS